MRHIIVTPLCRRRRYDTPCRHYRRLIRRLRHIRYYYITTTRLAFDAAMPPLLAPHYAFADYADAADVMSCRHAAALLI